MRTVFQLLRRSEPATLEWRHVSDAREEDALVGAFGVFDPAAGAPRSRRRR